MDFEQRESLIHKHFVAKMATMYLPPQQCKADKEASKMYGRELRKVINTRTSSDIKNPDVFVDQLEKIWDRCVAENSYRIWFTPALVAKHATRVNVEYVKRQQEQENTWERLASPAPHEEKPRATKDNPEAQGWTIEKCDAAIARTEELLGNSHIGKVLANIPKKAKERLIQKAGQIDSN